jgi:hypothetical protein
MISLVLKFFKRSNQSVKDLGSIANEVYNEGSGAYKMMIVEPLVVRAVGANDIITEGSYVKVTGTTYQLRRLGNAYNSSTTYRKGQTAVNAGNIYLAEEDYITGTFDITKWRYLAPETVGPITVVAGSVVTSGPYHNNVNAAGFLVADSAPFKKAE